jgi:hypothetical protein
MTRTVEPLSQKQVVGYLLEKRLIDAEDICGAGLSTSDVSRRNSNVKVIRELAPSYLIKRCVEHNAVETLANEAKIYNAIYSNSQLKILSRYIPQFYSYDATENLLVLELIGGNAEDLEHYHLRGHFSKGVARLKGRALAELHNAFTSDSFLRSGLANPAPGLPWIFSIHSPSLGQARDLSAASSQIIGIIQRHQDFPKMIDQCSNFWQATAMIHGDVKWANFILFSPTGRGRKTRLKVIDWEYAGLGDPCWDLGSVFSAYLSCWTLSRALVAVKNGRDENICRFQLESMQPAIRAFWKEYVSISKLSGRKEDEFLWRSTIFSAVRSLQTAIEQAQRGNVLSKNLVHLIQLSMNTLAYPVETIVRLFGIELKNGQYEPVGCQEA